MSHNETNVPETYSGSFTTVQTTSDELPTTTRRPFKGYDFPLDLSSFSVPLAITIIVSMVLCMVVFYTKARRRRQRLLAGTQNNLRSISGGVPMNVNAYRNYGMHLGAGEGADIPSPAYIGEQPPPYEIAITTPSSGGYAAPLQPYPRNGQVLMAPPSYLESVSFEQPSSSAVSSSVDLNQILSDLDVQSDSSVSESIHSCSSDHRELNHDSGTVSEHTLSTGSSKRKDKCDKDLTADVDHSAGEEAPKVDTTQETT